ncbi:MAG: glycosyltransferase family 1 protein [Saprospiraceae bacterium]|nr:glycosyltransferase family 1 protein [Saprospiraceae bacterium]
MEGINAEDGKEVLIANTAYEFAEKIDYCLKNPDILRGIGKRAQAFAAQNFGDFEIAVSVMEAYKNLISEKITA